MHDLGKHLPLLITSFEFGCCASLSLLMLLVRREDPTDAPRLPLLLISVLVLASLVSGNVALRWVSYPIKVVVKSCKLLPTMALGAMLLRKRYSRFDQLSAVLLCAGLVGFTLSESSGKGGGHPSSPVGVGVLLFAVSCDAVQVLLSERMLRSAVHLTPNHVMLYTNGFAFVAVIVAMLATDELARAPAQLPYGRLVLYGACSWVGVTCFIALTRCWGATAAVVATNARKLLTICLSFVLFPKPFSTQFALSGVAIVAGVAVHAYSKHAKREGGAPEPELTSNVRLDTPISRATIDLTASPETAHDETTAAKLPSGPVQKSSPPTATKGPSAIRRTPAARGNSGSARKKMA